MRSIQVRPATSAWVAASQPRRSAPGGRSQGGSGGGGETHQLGRRAADASHRHLRATPANGRPETIRANCEQSLRTLDVGSIDLYFLHKPDPTVPIAESVGAIAELRRAGKVRLIGVSNVSVPQLAEAASVVEISAVQNRLGFSERDRVIQR